MKILLIGECPWVPSSAGKITYYLARGFIEAGHEVLVECAGTGRPFTKFVSFNPSKWSVSLKTYYPDIDIYVGPARVGYVMRVWSEYDQSSKPDVIIAYGTSFGNVLGQLNDEIGRSGVPSILYITNDLVNLNPSFSASVLSYNYVVSPTRTSLEEVIKSLRYYYVNVDEVIDRFSVAYHGIDLQLYNRKTCDELCLDKDDDLVVGMFAKNHVRKDYQTLAYVVGRLIREGYNIHLGMYSVRGISAPVWTTEHINEQVELLEGVSLLDLNRVRVFDQFDDVEGVPEETVIKLYCRDIDIHMFLTRGESFGLPPIESLAFHTPTLTTDIPPQREIFTNDGKRTAVIPLIRTTVDKQMHPGLHIIDIDDAYSKLKLVLDGGWDFRDAYDYVTRFSYRRMCSDILDVLRRGHNEPLFKIMRKRGKVLAKYLPGVYDVEVVSG